MSGETTIFGFDLGNSDVGVEMASPHLTLNAIPEGRSQFSAGAALGIMINRNDDPNCFHLSGLRIRYEPWPIVIETAACHGTCLAMVDSYRLSTGLRYYGSKLIGHSHGRLQEREDLSHLSRGFDRLPRCLLLHQQQNDASWPHIRLYPSPQSSPANGPLDAKFLRGQ